MALARLTVWSAGQVLTASAQNDEFNNILNNPGSLICTTAAPSIGSLLVGRGLVTLGVLTVGSNNQVLTADSAESLGVKWAAVAAGGAPAFDTITSATNTSAAMVVGAGASLVPTSTGIIRASDLLFGSDANGDIAVRGASVYGRLALATRGHLLAGNGTTATSLSVGGTGRFLLANSAEATGLEWTAVTFSRGGTFVNADGVSTGNFIVWRAPFACTVTAVKGYRVGGSGATINARRNGTSNHLSIALSLTSADTWTDGGAVQNTAYVAGDKLEVMVVSATGSPTQIGIQVDFTRP